MSTRPYTIGLVGVGALLAGSLTMFAGTAAPAGATSAATAATVMSSPAREFVPPAQRKPASTTGVPILYDGNYYGYPSLNWSGYIVTTTGPYTSVSGEWIVPAVTARGPQYSSAWVGIGGATTTDLIQVGTNQDGFHGTGTYSAWWTTNEAGYLGQATWTLTCHNSPCTATPTALTVHPGDTMVATIHETSTPTVWSVTLLDATTGVQGTVTVTHTASTGSTGGNSAEWIVERTALVAPGGGFHFAKLANFGTVTFDTASANTQTPQFTANATISDAALMVQSAAKVIAIPSAPSTPDPDAFTVAYGDVAPTPPTS